MKKFCAVLAFVALHSSFVTAFCAATGQGGMAYQYYLKALLFESQGNFASAKAELDHALELAPESAYLYRTAAELSLRLGQVNKAAEEIDRAVEIDPKDVHALVIAGQIAWSLGETEKAESHLKRALSLDPDESEAVVSLASALTVRDPAQAIKLYNDFLTRHPNEIEIQERLAQVYQQTGNLPKAKSTWEDVLADSPNSLRAHLALAQIAEINYDTATAISHYEGVLEQDPTNLALLLRVGELRYRNNEMQKAYEAFNKAQSVAPSSPGANFWLALLAEHRGDWAEAIRLLKLVPQVSQEPGVQLRLSYYYSQINQFGEAIKILKQLSMKDPSNTDFLNYLAVAYEQNRQPAEAEKALKKIIDIDPNDAEAHFHLATLYDRTGRSPKAEDELRTAIRLKPDFHMAMNYLGYSFAEKNVHLDEAEKLVNDAISLDPDNAAYLDSMGWVYFKQGKIDRARDFLHEAIARTRDPLIYDHLGDVELAGGRPIDAILAWDDALRIDPKASPPRTKTAKAIRSISKSDKVGLFVKRAASNFGDIDSVNGLVETTVCEKKPCFHSKAQFAYARGDELKIEIPGPLTGPIMILTKPHGAPAKYGAVHPQFQSVEPFVTRAFDRIEQLLSGDTFKQVDLAQLAQSAVEKAGVLAASAGNFSVKFNASSGAITELSWKENGGSDILLPGKYGLPPSTALPKSFDWQDPGSGFSMRLEFLNPRVASASAEEPADKP